MKPNDLTDEQKKLVWRYVEVWRRFRRPPDGDRSFAKLEEDLAQGSSMFLCGLFVQAEASTVITMSRTARSSFTAREKRRFNGGGANRLSPRSLQARIRKR